MRAQNPHGGSVESLDNSNVPDSNETRHTRLEFTSQNFKNTEHKGCSVKVPVESSEKDRREADVFTTVTVEQGTNGTRAGSNHDIRKDTSPNETEGILDASTGESSDAGDVEVGPVTTEEDDGAGSGDERVEAQATRKVTEEVTRGGRMQSKLSFGLKDEGFVNVDVTIHESDGDSHVDILILTVVVVRNLSLQLEVTILEAELQSKDGQVPGHAETEAILELLKDLARQERHVPGSVEFHSGAHDKDHLQAVVFTVATSEFLVDTLHVGRKSGNVELALAQLDDVANAAVPVISPNALVLGSSGDGRGFFGSHGGDLHTCRSMKRSKGRIECLHKTWGFQCLQTTNNEK